MKTFALFDHHIFGSEILNCDLVTEDGVGTNSAFPDWQKEITTRSRRSTLSSYQEIRFQDFYKINDVLLSEEDLQMKR